MNLGGQPKKTILRSKRGEMAFSIFADAAGLGFALQTR